jgi:hypothetical protein
MTCPCGEVFDNHRLDHTRAPSKTPCLGVPNRLIKAEQSDYDG